MQRLSRAEQIELRAIPSAVWGSALLQGLPLALGELVGGGAILLFMQGFVRDL